MRAVPFLEPAAKTRHDLNKERTVYGLVNVSDLKELFFRTGLPADIYLRNSAHPFGVALCEITCVAFFDAGKEQIAVNGEFLFTKGLGVGVCEV